PLAQPQPHRRPYTTLFRSRARQPRRCQVGFAKDVEDGPGRADRVGGEQQTLEEAMRITLEEMAVLEDPGLALFAVHDHELRLARSVTACAPLDRRLEVRAAAPGQAGRTHLLD